MIKELLAPNEAVKKRVNQGTDNPELENPERFLQIFPPGKR